MSADPDSLSMDGVEESDGSNRADHMSNNSPENEMSETEDVNAQKTPHDESDARESSSSSEDEGSKMGNKRAEETDEEAEVEALVKAITEGNQNEGTYGDDGRVDKHNSAVENVTTRQKRPRDTSGANEDLTIKKQVTRKRVPRKVVSDLWQTLDKTSLESMSRILFIALNKATEKYLPQGRYKKSKKLEEAQRIITRSWISKGDSSSFNARLGVTRFPQKLTMGNTRKKDDFNFLGYDQLTIKKAHLETCLSAELSQLNDLQEHYNELNILYESDLKYLKSFKKTKDIYDAKNEKEMQAKSDELGINLKDIPLDYPEEQAKDSTTLFDPTTDEDTKSILSALDDYLSTQLKNTSQVSEINDRLELLYNKLDML